MFTVRVERAVLAMLMVCMALLMTNCSKNPQDPIILNEANSPSKVVSIGLAEKDLKPEFEKLAMLLSQRASRVIERIMATDKMNERAELSFAALNLDADLPRSFTTSDGQILETTLERAQPCNVMPSASTSVIIFAPDPDRFQPDLEDDICKGLRVESGNISPVTFTLEEYVKNFSHIPLYLVGYQGRRNSQSQSLAKSSKTAAGYWVACYKIHMKDDQDDFSNEECEVYIRPEPGTSRYKHETDFLFNGTYITDAAGRVPLFPDVNNTSSTYYCYDLPFFFQLTAENRGWVAIEEDVAPGTHNSNYYGPPPIPPVPSVLYKDVGVDVHHANGAKTWSTVRSFDYWWYSQGINDDDIWTSGCYEDFNTSWSVDENVDVWYSLNGNEFWMRKISY